jgi:tetratricopeptide (TPR) repeat protein
MHNIKDPTVRVPEGMTLAEYKLHQALQLFYEGKYARVIEECQDVVTVEHTNFQAYKRMGSAFYAMGNEEKALEAWKKSLQFNPTDKNLKEFINRSMHEMGLREKAEEINNEEIIEE